MMPVKESRLKRTFEYTAVVGAAVCKRQYGIGIDRIIYASGNELLNDGLGEREREIDRMTLPADNRVVGFGHNAKTRILANVSCECEKLRSW